MNPRRARNRSPRTRSIIVPDKRPAATAGIIRTAPRTPAATTPARLNTVTIATTVSAESAATPSIQVMPRRRMPSLANAWRRLTYAVRRTAGVRGRLRLGRRAVAPGDGISAEESDMLGSRGGPAPSAERWLQRYPFDQVGKPSSRHVDELRC